MRKKPAYKVDIASLQALCEANYTRIMKLFPRLVAATGRAGAFRLRVGREATVVATVTDQSRYTTHVDLAQDNSFAEWAEPPSFEVRIYHDVRMAEVVSFAAHRRVDSRYRYPNDRMYQEDEKFQQNRFLGEWLCCCLAHGFSSDRHGAFVPTG